MLGASGLTRACKGRAVIPQGARLASLGSTVTTIRGALTGYRDRSGDACRRRVAAAIEREDALPVVSRAATIEASRRFVAQGVSERAHLPLTRTFTRPL